MMSPALTPGTPAVSGLIPPFVEPGCRVTSISPRQIVMLFGDLHSKVLNELQGVCVCVCVCTCGMPCPFMNLLTLVLFVSRKWDSLPCPAYPSRAQRTQRLER
jgi:hypothetical protein